MTENLTYNINVGVGLYQYYYDGINTSSVYFQFIAPEVQFCAGVGWRQQSQT